MTPPHTHVRYETVTVTFLYLFSDTIFNNVRYRTFYGASATYHRKSDLNRIEINCIYFAPLLHQIRSHPSIPRELSTIPKRKRKREKKSKIPPWRFFKYPRFLYKATWSFSTNTSYIPSSVPYCLLRISHDELLFRVSDLCGTFEWAEKIDPSHFPIFGSIISFSYSVAPSHRLDISFLTYRWRPVPNRSAIREWNIHFVFTLLTYYFHFFGLFRSITNLKSISMLFLYLYGVA